MEPSNPTPAYPQKTFGYSHQVAIFNVKPTDCSVVSRQNVDFGPIAAIRPHAPVEFNIMGNNSNYIDMKNIRIHVKLKITLPNGSSISENDHVALANMPISTIFSSCELYLQQRRVDTCLLYPYRAMIDTLLFSDTDEMSGELTLGLFDRETFGTLAITDPNPTEGPVNLRLNTRSDYTADSKEVELVGKVHLDLFKCDRYMINAVQMQVIFRQSTDAFRLLSGSNSTEYKVEITDVFLRVPMLEMSNAIMVSHNDGLSLSPAYFPYIESDFKTYVIPAGSAGRNIDNLYLGNIPSRVIVGFVNQSAFNGAYDKNPFLFDHFNLSYMAFMINGMTYPSKGIQCDFDNDQFSEGLSSIYSMIGDECIRKPVISRNEFKAGYALFSIPVEPHVPDEEFTQRRAHGLNGLIIRLKDPVDEPIVVIVYAKFSKVLAIDQARNIYPGH